MEEQSGIPGRDFTILREVIGSQHYQKLILICDGSKWILNWVNDTYPRAIQVLDFYHAC